MLSKKVLKKQQQQQSNTVLELHVCFCIIWVNNMVFSKTAAMPCDADKYRL